MKLITLVAIVLTVTCTYAANIGHILRTGVTTCYEDDPLEFEGGSINITADPLIIINEGSFAGPGVAIGFSKLESYFNINIANFNATFVLTLPSVHLKGGSYSAAGVIDARQFRQETIPSGPFSGNGSYEVWATDIKLEGNAVLLLNPITGTIIIRILTVNTFKFGHILVNLESFIVDEMTIDWAKWNANFKANFDVDWGASKDEIITTVRSSMNQILREHFTPEKFFDILGRIPIICTPHLKMKL